MTTTELITTVDALNKAIADKSEQMAALAREIAFASELQAFEPRAFVHGSCRVGARCSHPFNATWVLTLGNGEQIERDARDVPMHLWPAGLRAQYEALPKRLRPRLGRVHPIVKSLRVLRERAMYGAGAHPMFDARDSDLLRARIKARKAITQPLQGDYLILANGEVRRVAHVWKNYAYTEANGYAESGIEGVQPSAGGSVYLSACGSGSYSGSLDPIIKAEKIEDTGEFRAARFWFFHHDHARAHCGVDCFAPVRVWRVAGVS